MDEKSLSHEKEMSISHRDRAEVSQVEPFPKK